MAKSRADCLGFGVYALATRTGPKTLNPKPEVSGSKCFDWSVLRLAISSAPLGFRAWGLHSRNSDLPDGVCVFGDGFGFREPNTPQLKKIP